METRPIGITIVSLLMIIFGVGKIATSFTYYPFEISTAQIIMFTYSAVVIGALYVLAGLLILSMRKWAAILAIALLSGDVVWRLALVVTEHYTLGQIISILIGTGTAAVFAIYIGLRWSVFR